MKRMSRPTLEVADIACAAATVFGNSSSRILHGSHRGARCHRPVPHRGIGRLIAITASTAAIRPSRLTRRNRHCPGARRTHAPSGWLRARLNCCPCRTSTSSSSSSRTNCPPLSSRNKRLLYDLLYRTSAPQRGRNWRARIPGTWEPTSDSSACSIPVDRTLSIIPMSTTSFPPAAWPSIVPDGSSSRRFFLPVKVPVESSAASSSMDCTARRTGQAQFHGLQQYLATWPLPPSSGSYSGRIGSSTPSYHSAALNTFSTTRVRCTHRVAISRHRLVAFENDRVSFLGETMPRAARRS